MSARPFPIRRYLVPEEKPIPPEGFTRVDERIVNGLPHSIQLSDNIMLVVVIPNGQAVAWRDADPAAVLSSSGDELLPAAAGGDEPVGHVKRAPARILVRISGKTAASVPLVAGLRRSIPDSGDGRSGVRIELAILSWDLTTGIMRGGGDFGSSISLAWRRADRAVEHYSTPVINPHLVPRLKPQFRMMSALGLVKPVRLARFNVKKVVKL